MKLCRIGVGFGVVAAIAAVSPLGVAQAQDKKALKKIEDANAKAMEEYDLLEFESAKKLLNGALVEVKRAGLDKHPIAAKTHGNLGIVYEGLGDPDNALLEFISALEIDGKWTLPKEYKKPELQKIFESARGTVGKGGRPTVPPSGSGGDDEPDEPADDSVSGFKHTLVEEGRTGQSIKITARVGADVGASTVVVYYRGVGQEEFSSSPLRKKGSSWEGSIPASATRGDSVQYYVEAQDDTGKALDNSGNRGSPNIIEIAGGASASGVDPEDSENPLGGGEGSSDDNGVSRGVEGKSKYSVYVNVAVGSGAGFVSGDTEQSGEPVKAGIAPGLLHIEPELGFWLSPKVTLSIYARIGLPLGANIPGHSAAAPAGLVRVGYHMGGSDGGLAFHGDLGGGFLRHTVKLKMPFAPDLERPNETGDVDTVASGPLLVGGGLSWTASLAGPLRFFVDASLLAGIPVVAEVGGVEPQFAVNADASLGFQLAF